MMSQWAKTNRLGIHTCSVHKHVKQNVKNVFLSGAAKMYMYV